MSPGVVTQRKSNILVHDYAGHPFQVELSRKLAARGHKVTHCYDGNLVTPHGNLSKGPSDSARFKIVPLNAGSSLAKHALLKRWRQERAYGKVLARFILEKSPDIVLSANTPLGAQTLALDAARQIGAGFVYWVQDLLGVGIDRAVRSRIPLAGGLVGRHFIRLEQRLLAASDAIVAISEDFSHSILRGGAEKSQLHVIENWGAITEFDELRREDSWKERNGLAGKFIFLYSGTLGLKHNPGAISTLAKAFKGDSNVAVVVASEGVGAEWLRNQRLPNLHVMNFRPYAELPSMLQAADVLLALLEPDASFFSVPSKVLTYMCAGRPILAAIPTENLAARLIELAGAGLSVSPTNSSGLVSGAQTLRNDEALRTRLGESGRLYAERHFKIDGIADKFEAVLDSVMTTTKTKEREAV